MDRRDVAFSLVQDLLAAPGSQEGWQAFLCHLCEALEGSGANFLSHHLLSNEGVVSVSARTAPEALALYQQHWHQFDPWVHNPALEGVTAGVVVSGEQLLAPDDMQRTAFYNDFGRQYDVFQTLAAVIEKSRGVVSGITVNRAERQRSFDTEDLALLTLLVPPLQRALQVHRRLTGAELMAAHAMDVLDRLPHGVLLVSAAGMVLSTNRAADEILRARDGLTVERGELRASTIALTNQLRSSLEAAIRTSQGVAIDGTSTALALPRPSGRRALSVIIAPLPARRALLTSDAAVAAVFVKDPENSRVPDADTIRTIFGLTPSEAELVRCLLSGLSLEQAAAQLGLRIDTVRKRLKAVFEKTDTHRQADLVKLVLSS